MLLRILNGRPFWIAYTLVYLVYSIFVTFVIEVHVFWIIWAWIITFVGWLNYYWRKPREQPPYPDIEVADVDLCRHIDDGGRCIDD